jgi:hypothetical protein
VSRLPLGFTSVKELITYSLGAVTLWYGVTQAPSDKALMVVGAAFGLLGLPVIGGFFEKKD